MRTLLLPVVWLEGHIEPFHWERTHARHLPAHLPRRPLSRHPLGPPRQRRRPRMAALALATSPRPRRRLQAHLPRRLLHPAAAHPRTARPAAALPPAAPPRRPHPTLHALGKERPPRPHPCLRHLRRRRPTRPDLRRLARCRTVRG